MESNIGLNFDGKIKTEDAKKNLHIPIVNTNSKTEKIKAITKGSDAALSSEVPVKELVIDLSYQRLPNESKVRSIAKNFNPDALGVLICSAREDGTIAVLDGGHRVAALRMLNLENTNVDCLVYFGLSISEEANIFNIMNDSRTKPKTQDLFRAKVVAKDSDAIKINNILIKHGLGIANGPTNNAIRAMGTVTKMFKKNGEKNLDNTIMILKEAFGTHTSAFSDVAIMAVSNTLLIYKGIDIKRYIETLKRQGNATNWIANGSIISAQIRAKDRSVGMAIVAIKDYNKKLKSNRLDEKILW